MRKMYIFRQKIIDSTGVSKFAHRREATYFYQSLKTCAKQRKAFSCCFLHERICLLVSTSEHFFLNATAAYGYCYGVPPESFQEFCSSVLYQFTVTIHRFQNTDCSKRRKMTSRTLAAPKISTLWIALYFSKFWEEKTVVIFSISIKHCKPTAVLRMNWILHLITSIY